MATVVIKKFQDWHENISNVKYEWLGEKMEDVFFKQYWVEANITNVWYKNLILVMDHKQEEAVCNGELCTVLLLLIVVEMLGSELNLILLTTSFGCSRSTVFRRWPWVMWGRLFPWLLCRGAGMELVSVLNARSNPLWRGGDGFWNCCLGLAKGLRADLVGQREEKRGVASRLKSLVMVGFWWSSWWVFGWQVSSWGTWCLCGCDPGSEDEVPLSLVRIREGVNYVMNMWQSYDQHVTGMQLTCDNR